MNEPILKGENSHIRCMGKGVTLGGKDYPGTRGAHFNVRLSEAWNPISLEEMETAYVKANSKRPNIAYKVYKFISNLLRKVK